MLCVTEKVARDNSSDTKLSLGSGGKKPLAWSRNAQPENPKEGRPGQVSRPQGAAPSQAGESPKPLGTGTRPRLGAREAGTPTLSQQWGLQAGRPSRSQKA